MNVTGHDYYMVSQHIFDLVDLYNAEIAKDNEKKEKKQKQDQKE